MFNVTVKGNVRCNGLSPTNIGDMAKQKHHTTNKLVLNNIMSPSARHHSITADAGNKLKFSDRLKAYLSTDGLRKTTDAPPALAAVVDLDDPYAFSDSEQKHQASPQPPPPLPPPPPQRFIVANNKRVNECSAAVVNNKNNIINKVNNHHAIINNTSDGGGVGVKTMMHRLQTQIARNKVNVKHNNRLSPDFKIEKNHSQQQQQQHFLDKNTKHSIIGLVNNLNSNDSSLNQGNLSRRLPPSGKPIPAHLRARRASSKLVSASKTLPTAAEPTHRVPPAPNSRWHAPQPLSRFVSGPGYESSDTEDESLLIYQNQWFSKELELLANEDGHRQERLEFTRTELKRQLVQIKRSKHRSEDSLNRDRLNLEKVLKKLARDRRRDLAMKTRNSGTNSSSNSNGTGLMAPTICSVDDCTRQTLPCTKYCVMHIMKNSDQILFDHCTAKFADNTQCSVPVFDITHELPLCIEHARKRDNYNRMCLETKPKKPRRKIKPSAMIRPQKRNKKRKRPQKNTDTCQTQVVTTITNVSDVSELNVCENSSAYESSEDVALGTISENEFVQIKEDHLGEQDVVEQVLAMQEEVGADLNSLVVEQTLVTQASRLLEETDFTTVLNQIPADEFNDLFTVDRNGEYEPSREETEELERALEAVDEDVKSLEKLSQTQGLLDSLLDEHTLVESLVQIPDVFHNGYASVASVENSQSPRPITIYHPVLHGVDGMLPQPPQAHAPS